MIKARKLCNIFVDLNAINDAGIFDSNFVNIYPEELELHRENGNNTKPTFLGPDSKIKYSRFHIDAFDKRSSFSLSIVRMPEKSSNISSNIFYMTSGVECLRIATACNNKNPFLNSINPLVRHMISQGK